MYINKEELSYPFHISKPMINIYNQKYLQCWWISILDKDGKEKEYTQTAFLNGLGLDLSSTDRKFSWEKLVCWVGLINLRLLGILILVTISQSTWQITNHNTLLCYTEIVIYLVTSIYVQEHRKILIPQSSLTNISLMTKMKLNAPGIFLHKSCSQLWDYY